MGGIMLAWLVGMGLVSWRYVKVQHSPPAPGDLLVASGAFAICGVVGMANAKVGALLAVGLDAAALLRILDGQDVIPSPLGAISAQSKSASSRLTGSSTTSSTTKVPKGADTYGGGPTPGPVQR